MDLEVEHELCRYCRVCWISSKLKICFLQDCQGEDARVAFHLASLRNLNLYVPQI